MIVKHCKEGWEIISHYAHGLLAGKLAMQLKPKWRSDYWTDTITAIIEHDDHLLNFDEQDYLTDRGTPMDFTMESSSDHETLEHAKRLYEQTLQKSQLMALLVGRHLAFLNESLSKDYKPMREFLEHMANKRKNQRKIYGLDQSQEDHLYNVLLFCDRCSLILAQSKIPEVGRQLEINNTIEGKTYFISQARENSVTVNPWPFHLDRFQVEFEYRILKEISFENNDALQDAISESDINLRSFTFQK